MEISVWYYSSVNGLTLTIQDDEPFIEAKVARMVYYVEDKVDKGWCIPVHIKPRDVYDMGDEEGNLVHESE
ncbi:hypothetical protein LINPERPRIM_LOCUS2991, partial [Linum perenne]